MDRSWIDTAQEEIGRHGLAGWLLYDFRGSNPLAAPFLHFPGALLTRRVFAFVPAEGAATLVVSAIEAGSIDAGPFRLVTYTSHASLDQVLRELLPDGPVAMEISPRGDVPYVSTVDAGTVERIRDLGGRVVPSADLLQAFAAWTPAQVEDHRHAAREVMEALEAAFGRIREATAAGRELRETEVQTLIAERFDARGLVYDHRAIVGFGPNSGDPHYAPREGRDRALQPGDPILIDLFARRNAAGAPYADVTWMGVYGEPDPDFLEVFELVTGARRLGLEVLTRAWSNGPRPRGREIDRAVRDRIAAAGYGEAFVHRTGHSLGSLHTHGDAVHLDDFETRDDRTIRPGLGLTLEPGVYLPAFGVRSEMDVLITEAGPEATTGQQSELVRIPLGPHHA